jgi:hypothetical protein
MLRLLIAVAVLTLVIYFVGTSAIKSLTAVGEEAGEGLGGRKLGLSPFKVTFKDQYLCYSYDRGEWIMRGHDNGNECKGPFIDSVSLCRAMGEVEMTQVRLFHEGRMLECS